MAITPTQLPTHSHTPLKAALCHVPLKKITGIALLCLLAVGALFAARTLIRSRSAELEPEPINSSDTSQRRRSSTTSSPYSGAFMWIDLVIEQVGAAKLTAPFKTAGPPTNIKIIHLKNLYPRYVTSLVNQIKSASNNPWAEKNLLDAEMIGCVNLLYAISCLTLDEVPSLAQGKTCLEVLTNKDLYPCQTFYLIGMFYHMIRSAPVWDETKKQFVCSDPIPKSYIQLFYEKGTTQSHWRELYNDYCKRVNSFLKPEDLTQLGLPIQWMQEDADPQTFTPCHDRGFFTFT